nr:hypothetical protein [Angustibacter aerolatus]
MAMYVPTPAADRFVEDYPVARGAYLLAHDLSGLDGLLDQPARRRRPARAARARAGALPGRLLRRGVLRRLRPRRRRRRGGCRRRPRRRPRRRR